MNNLLIALTVSANDSVRAEKLLDFIAAQRGKRPSGSVLIVGAPDLHEEARVRLKLAAEVGFQFVEVIGLPWPQAPITSDPRPKYEMVNYIYESLFVHVRDNYKCPVLVIEPDCVPVKSDWVERIQAAYELQPKRLMGSFLANGPDKPPANLSRVAVYPHDIHRDFTLQKATMMAKTTFEIGFGDIFMRRATKTRMIQYMKYDANTDPAKIWPEAVLVHGDKESVLLSSIQSASKKIEPATAATSPFLRKVIEVNPGVDVIHLTQSEEIHKDAKFLNSPPAVESSERLGLGSQTPVAALPQPESPYSGDEIPGVTVPRVEPKIDKRTKAGRAMKAQAEPIAA